MRASTANMSSPRYSASSVNRHTKKFPQEQNRGEGYKYQKETITAKNIRPNSIPIDKACPWTNFYTQVAFSPVQLHFPRAHYCYRPSTMIRCPSHTRIILANSVPCRVTLHRSNWKQIMSGCAFCHTMAPIRECSTTAMARGPWTWAWTLGFAWFVWVATMRR